MSELRGLSVLGRPAALGTGYPVRDRLGSFHPLPGEPPAPLVLAVHPLDRGPRAPEAATAARLYLSSGLAATDGIFRPLGWLVDVRA